MNDSSDNNPTHYDDLIRELNELKRFIERSDDPDGGLEKDTLPNSPGDSDNPVIGGSHGNSQPVRTDYTERTATNTEIDGDPVNRAVSGDDTDDVNTDISDTDEFPTLSEVVSRKQPTDELQLDLLSPTRSEESVDPVHHEPANKKADDIQVADSDSTAVKTMSGLQHRASGSDTMDDNPTINLDESTPDDGDSDGDDEILEFVLDLSDRIMATIEDRLLERSGELIPDDLRDELREAIGDILYEWCER